MCDSLYSLLSVKQSFQVVNTVCGLNSKNHEQYKGVTDILVIDVCENTPLDGLVQLFSFYNNSKILVVTSSGNHWFLSSLIHHGADGCFLATEGAAQLSVAIAQVYLDNWYLSPRLHQHLHQELKNKKNQLSHAPTKRENSKSDFKSIDINHLTNREVEILKLLAIGDSSADIAKELYISESTVNTHRKHILKKLGISSTPMLIRCITEQGIV